MTENAITFNSTVGNYDATKYSGLVNGIEIVNLINSLFDVVNKGFEKSDRARFTIEIHECRLTSTT